MSKKILAFDFGGSSGRAMVGEYDEQEKCIHVEEVHRFTNDTVLVNGHMYWDILRLFFEVKAGIAKALKFAGHIDAIGIDTWGVDFGLLDERGELLGNPVHYRDERTVGMPEEVFETVSKHELYQRTGIQCMRINTLYQLYYLFHYRPEVMAAAKTMLFIPDLFAYFLTGEKRAERTNATTSNMFDPVVGDWAYDVLEKLGIDRKVLPPIIRTGEAYGTLLPEICEELGCDPIPVIAVCTHDTASAVLSAPAEGDFAYISCGTWSLFGTELARPLINDASEKVEYTNEGGYGGTTTFLKNIMGLWLIQESRRQWIREGFDVSYADLEREALAAEPFRSFIDCDAPEFELAGDLPGRVRQFCRATGQPVPESRGEVMRCIYQSLAMKYKQNYTNLCELAGKQFAQMNMLGGGIKDTLLCRMTADATGVKVVAGPAEATVIGNISAQLLALGQMQDVREVRDVVKRSTPLKVYEPTEPEAWEKHYDAFRAVLGKTGRDA